jgi:DNA polymerase-3 subunit epsilon
MSKCIFIDTETTSANPDRGGLIQLSGIIEIDGTIAEEFDIHTNIFKNDEVTEEALQTNGYTLEQIYGFSHPNKAFVEFRKLLEKYVDPYNKADKFIALAYVANFDNTVLREWFRKNGSQYFGSYFWHPWIDIFNLAAYLYQDQRAQFENFKMKTVAAYLGIECDQEQCHGALYDTKIARQIYYKLTSQ